MAQTFEFVFRDAGGGMPGPGSSPPQPTQPGAAPTPRPANTLPPVAPPSRPTPAPSAPGSGMPGSIPAQVSQGAATIASRAAAGLPGLGLLLGAGSVAAGVAAIPAAAGAFAAANSRVSQGLRPFSPELQQAAAEQRVLDTERRIDLAQRYGADLARTQQLSGLAFGIGETVVTDFLADFSAILRGDIRRAIDQTDLGAAVGSQVSNWWAGTPKISSIFQSEFLPDPPEFSGLFNSSEDVTRSSDVVLTGLGF